MELYLTLGEAKSDKTWQAESLNIHSHTAVNPSLSIQVRRFWWNCPIDLHIGVLIYLATYISSEEQLHREPYL